MNILVLSDLNWEPHLRSMTENEVVSFDVSRIGIPRYQRIYRYLQIIEDEKADLVLFAGDVTGDGSCGHGFHFAFTLLLSFLERKQIPSVFISGNHDDTKYYDQVVEVAKSFEYSKNINNEVIDIAGMKILGIPYSTSKRKTSLNKLLNSHTDKYDIVLAHAQLKRRIRLFDIDCKYIFTGHYDRKIFAHRDKIFVALDNDSEEVSYSVIQASENKADSISYKIRPHADVVFSLTENSSDLLEGTRNSILYINNMKEINLAEMEKAPYRALINESGNYLYFKYLRGHHYQASLETMYKAKHEIELNENDLPLDKVFQLQITDAYRISNSFIQDYLGKLKVV